MNKSKLKFITANVLKKVRIFRDHRYSRLHYGFLYLFSKIHFGIDRSISQNKNF